MTTLVLLFPSCFIRVLSYQLKYNSQHTSLTKPKVARYDLEGIEEMIPQLWSSTKFGYGFLKEIVARCANEEEYTFKEAYFLRIHLNDIKDMYLLYAQNKLYHLTGDEQTDLVRCASLDIKEPFTIFYKPRGVVYLNKDDMKCLMRADEVYKFGDGTLKKRGKTSMLKEIEKILLTRRIMRSLECFMGGRKIEMDYRLLTRTE
ncbi:hypothetical protein Tco_1411137 [Tanacetum coccineum]